MQRHTTFLIGLASIALLAACGDDPKKRPLGETCGDDGECTSGMCLSGLCLDPEADEDDDGLINRIEAGLGSNPLNPDSDYDGVADGDELNGFDARDTDGDGDADILESLVTDDDQDCLPDELDPDNGTVATDLSPAVPSLCSRNGVCRSQIGSVRLECDANKNPICIYSDIATYEAEEATCDGLDNDCDGDADEGFRDSDGDGTADCADDDIDGDGAVQASDNCPLIENSAQTDADNDDLGDACDAPAEPKVGPFTPPAPSSDTTPTSHGTAEPLSIVRFFSDATCTTKVGEGAASATGVFSFDVTLSGSGVVQLWAQSENPAGLLSDCIPAGSFEIDLALPAGPENLIVRASAWTETDATFGMSGLVEPFAAVQIFANATCSGEPLQAVSDESGAWSASATYANTTGAISLQVTDVAGNTTACIVGPTLFGEVTAKLTQEGVPEVEQEVVFHYPDGSFMGTKFTDSEGLATHVVFAGCGITTSVDSNEGYAEWVSVLDVVPGQTVPFAVRGFGQFLDRSDAINYSWPTGPEGAVFYEVTTACNTARIYADGIELPWTYYYYGGCLSLTTFDAAVVAYDTNGLPIGFSVMLDNLVPENSDVTTDVSFGAWRTDFERFTINLRNVSSPSPYEASMSQVVDGAVFFDRADSDFFLGDTTTEFTLPKITGATYDWSVKLSHLGANGEFGVRGHLATGSGATNVVDANDMLPRLFDGRADYENNGEVGRYVGFHWDGEAGVGNTAAGLFQTSFATQVGTLDWTIIFAPRGDSGAVPFPSVDGELYGSSFLDVVYYTYDDNVTFFAYPDATNLGAIIDACATDIIGCLYGAKSVDYTSCCDYGRGSF